MSTSQDGRLELDELGAVLDDAASLGDAGETLGDHDGTPSLGQRVAASGVGAWADRHRGLVRSAAVVAAVVGVGFLVRTATAAPPPSPDVVATVAPDLAASVAGIAQDPGGTEVMTTAWLVSGVRPGESVRLTGIEGPGVRASQAQPVGEPTDGVQRWTVAGALGCEGTDVTADGATPTPAYALDLERTDAWGRVATSSVPLPAGSPPWADLVGQVCWPDEAARGVHVDRIAVRADTTRAVVTVGLDLSSSLDLPVLVGVAADSTTTTEVGRSFLAPLEPDAGTQLDATVRVTSCDGAAPPVVRPDQRVSGGDLLPGIPLEVQAARDSRVALVPVVFDPDQTALVQAAIDQVCAGAPRISATVVDARRSSLPPTNGSIGVSAPVLLEIELTVSSSVSGDATVTLTYGGQQSAPRQSLVRAPVVAGADATTLVVFYEVQCLSTPPPPRLSVVVDDDGRARPSSRVLDDAQLEEAILEACADLTPEMLTTSGWPRPAR